MTRELITIGRRDVLDLPDLDITDLDAKVDTGAYGCALHSHHVQVVEKDGQEVLEFKLLDPKHPAYEARTYYCPDFSEKKVRNSGGMVEHRFAIMTTLVLFGREYEVEMSLTNRKKMKYPILLGRKFLQGRFLVDVAKKNVSYKKKNTAK